MGLFVVNDIVDYLDVIVVLAGHVFFLQVGSDQELLGGHAGAQIAVFN
jgi:hypothetical protein